MQNQVGIFNVKYNGLLGVEEPTWGFSLVKVVPKDSPNEMDEKRDGRRVLGDYPR